jgi:hypothetical protein
MITTSPHGGLGVLVRRQRASDAIDYFLYRIAGQLRRLRLRPPTARPAFNCGHLLKHYHSMGPGASKARFVAFVSFRILTARLSSFTNSSLPSFIKL